MKTLMALRHKNEDDYLTPSIILVDDEPANMLVNGGYYRELTDEDVTAKPLKVVVDGDGGRPLIVPSDKALDLMGWNGTLREATPEEISSLFENVSNLLSSKVTDEFEVARALEEVIFELKQAVGAFGPIASLHEAYGVIAEEFKEFEEHVFMKQSRRNLGKARAEACQLAAMAIRTMIDCCQESS